MILKKIKRLYCKQPKLKRHSLCVREYNYNHLGLVREGGTHYNPMVLSEYQGRDLLLGDDFN